MSNSLILASGSKTRQAMLQNVGVDFESIRPRVDEDMIKESLILEGASPRDIADSLAEAKANHVSRKAGSCFVLGCDQVLDLGGNVLSKAKTKTEAKHRLKEMRGNTHILYSAAVIYQDQKPVWRHIGKATLTMRHFSDAFLEYYLENASDALLSSVGCYEYEAAGAQLFSHVQGDYFTILGLPLLDVLEYLRLRQVILK